MVNGDAFSCETSRRRLNSLSFSVVNCDVPLVNGDLFSASTFTLSKHSTFKSALPAAATLASFEEVDDEVEGGLGSKRNTSLSSRSQNSMPYMSDKDHEVDFSLKDPLRLHDLEKPNMLQWNVDEDDNPHSNDDNQCSVVETNHRHLILEARKQRNVFINHQRKETKNIFPPPISITPRPNQSKTNLV